MNNKLVSPKDQLRKKTSNTIKNIKNGYNTVGDKTIYKPRLTVTQINSIKSLREQGLNLKEIGRQLNINHVTVSRVLAVNDPVFSDLKYIDRLKFHARSEWRVLGHRSGENITEEKLEKSSALQLATIKAISEDKSRLIEGEVTQRIGFDELSDKELEDKIKKDQELLKRIEKGEIVDAEISEEGEDEGF